MAWAVTVKVEVVVSLARSARLVMLADLSVDQQADLLVDLLEDQLEDLLADQLADQLVGLLADQPVALDRVGLASSFSSFSFSF